ncbi:hypothetical protein [Bacillus safensis]|uniref:hypothetical protein n=1 Tax=Bacillus safensis TaxID=561879 RepID=UPI003CFD5FD2
MHPALDGSKLSHDPNLVYRDRSTFGRISSNYPSGTEPDHMVRVRHAAPYPSHSLHYRHVNIGEKPPKAGLSDMALRHLQL